MSSENTRDIAKFGNRERDIAGKLLQLAYKAEFLSYGVAIEFNPNSGMVFLVDEDYNVGVLNEDETEVVQFITCSECGYEGTKSDYEFDKENGNTNECCKEFFEEQTDEEETEE